MRPTKDLTDADVWTMRAVVFIFGSYCVTFTLIPIIQKVFINKSIGLGYVVGKQKRFLTLITAGAGVAGIFPFYDLIDHDAYYCILSFFTGLFFIIETHISYWRLPFQLLSPNTRSLLKITVYFQISLNVCRLCLDVVTFIWFFVHSYPSEYYIFVRVVRMFSSFIFGITEIIISKKTSDLVSTPRANMTKETKEILRDTKHKLQALSKANIAGAVAAIVDIVDSWFELQMLTATVISAGSVTFVFYGQLFRMGLEDKEREDNKGVEQASDSRPSRYSVPVSVSLESDSV